MVFNSELAWLYKELDATEELLAQYQESYLMRISLENRIEDIKGRIEEMSKQEIAPEAKIDMWFSGEAVFGSLGISSAFMEKTMHSLVGMIQAKTRKKVNDVNADLKLKHKKQTAKMPKGKFYITGVTHGSFGYEMEFKEQGNFLKDEITANSIREVMKIIDDTSKDTLNVDDLIDTQPLKLLSHLKDFLTIVEKQHSIVKMKSGDVMMSLDVPHVARAYDNICKSDITTKEDSIIGIFQGAFIESGKFEYTDEEGKVKHGDVSEDLSYDEIAEINRAFSRKDCRLHVIRNIVAYSNGKKNESVELTGIEALE